MVISFLLSGRKVRWLCRFWLIMLLILLVWVMILLSELYWVSYFSVVFGLYLVMFGMLLMVLLISVR